MEFPTWLILALISPFFWGIVHVLDSYCVEEVFNAPWIGSVTSALTMLAFLPLISVGLVWADSSRMTHLGVLECVIAGAVFMVSQILYFKALAISESGIVAAYWNLLPLMLLLLSYLLFGEQLSTARYVGSACLILASVLFCLVDGNLEFRWYSLWFMTLASCFQAAYFLLLDHAFQSNSVYPAFLISTVSMIAFGLVPLLRRERLNEFTANWPKIWLASKFLLAIEVANLVAVGTNQYAIKYGNVSLVASVEATVPAFTLGLSIALFAIFRRYGEEEASRRIRPKAILVALMIVGVWLVS